MSPICVYFHHSVFYSILVLLLLDGSVADRSTSCRQFSNPATETTVYRGDGCFLLSRVPRTWEESKTFCENLGNGWSLVVIEDAETQKHVDNLTAAVSSGSWIGLRQQDNGYKWVSGNSLGYPSFFRELGVGEEASPGECITTSPSEDKIYGTWNYAECTRRLFTICHTDSGSIHQRATTAAPPKTTSTTKSTPTSTSTSTTTSTSTLTPAPTKTHTTVKDKATTSITTTQAVATTQAQAVATTTSSVQTSEEHAATVPTSSSTRTPTSSVQARPIAGSTPTRTATPSVHATPRTSTKPVSVLIPVASGVVVAAVAVLGVAVILCRRNKAKRLRVRTVDPGTDDDRECGDPRTKPVVEYAAVIPRRERQTSQAPRCDVDPGYHYIPVEGEDSAGQAVSDQVYDTTAPREKQPVKLDDTYDRARFRQEDVYDHTCLTRKSPQTQDTGHYDHVVL